MKINPLAQNILTHRTYIALEFLILCVLIPALIIYYTWAPLMFRFLYGGALYAFIILKLTDGRRFKTLWNWQAVSWNNLKPILIRLGFACIGMVMFLIWYDPDRLFSLLYERPSFVPVLLVAYPILSAFPQELVFCTFFFARYHIFFKTEKRLIVASAIVFAYAHILYINPVAPALSLLGGLVFAMTYAKTKSLALVTIEHGLYGNALFLIGLGWYFYSGAVLQTG